MQVIAHHRVGVDRHREALGQQAETLFDPSLAVLERLAGVVIDPAQECAADAALDAVVMPVGAGWDKLAAGLGHGARMTVAARAVCRASGRWRVGIS